MITVGVEGDAGGRVLGELTRLAPLHTARGREVRVVDGSGPGEPVHILVSMAGKPTRRADILVTPGTLALDAANRCGPVAMVTVGLDSRDTMTPSSMLQEGGMATLQREISGPGGPVAPQEVDLRGLEGTLDEKMAVAATLLLLDGRQGW